MSIYKPFGWETLELRYGGLRARLETLHTRVVEYLDEDVTTVTTLPELEVEAQELYPGQGLSMMLCVPSRPHSRDRSSFILQRLRKGLSAYILLICCEPCSIPPHPCMPFRSGPLRAQLMVDRELYMSDSAGEPSRCIARTTAPCATYRARTMMPSRLVVRNSINVRSPSGADQIPACTVHP
jgi:hypothetical protein